MDFPSPLDTVFCRHTLWLCQFFAIENCHSFHSYVSLPEGIPNKWPIEIVDLPIQKMVMFPSFFVYQRVKHCVDDLETAPISQALCDFGIALENLCLDGCDVSVATHLKCWKKHQKSHMCDSLFLVCVADHYRIIDCFGRVINNH